MLNYKIAKTRLIEKKNKNDKIFTSCLDIFYLNNKINFWIRNKEFIIFKSSNLIIKNLNKICYNLKVKNIHSTPAVSHPEIRIVTLLRYIFIKYCFCLVKKLFSKFINLNKNIWKIYLINSNLSVFLSNKNIYKKALTIKPVPNF